MKKINSILMSTILLFVLIGCGEVTTSGESTVSTVQSTNNNSVDNSSVSQNINAQKIYEKCAGCHGTNGEKFALGKSQVIGGDNKAALLYQLQEYKTGRLNQYGMGALMKGQVVGLSDSELELVSTYVSRLSGI